MMDNTGDSKRNKSTAKLKNTHAEDQSSELPCPQTRKILAILGALPTLLSPPYLPSYSLTRSSVVYCVIVFSIVSYDVVYSVINKKRMYDEEDPSETMRTQHLEHMAAMLPYVLVIHFWMDVPALLSSFECYKDLQEKFRTATGRPLINRRRAKEWYSVLTTVLVLLLLLCCILIFSDPKFRMDIGTAVASFYGNTLAICATYLWVGLSWGICDAARDMKEEFRRQLDFMTPSRVYEFRLVWLAMRNALDSMGNFMCTSTAYSMSLCGVVVLLYECAVLVQIGEVFPAVSHLVCGAFYVGLVSIICRTSHHVQDEMKCLVAEVLPNISLTSYDIKTQREIEMLFLIESARPAVTNFHGFILVNKSLILSFFSNISTYLIVLVQFNQNGDGFSM